MVLRTIAIGNSNRNSKCSCLRAIRYSGSIVNAYFCICWVLTVLKAYTLVISYACNLRFYSVRCWRCSEIACNGITVWCICLAFRLIDVNRHINNIVRVIIIGHFHLYGIGACLFTIRYFAFINNANRSWCCWCFIIFPCYAVTITGARYTIFNISITCSVRKRNSITNRFIFIISVTNGDRHFNRVR